MKNGVMSISPTKIGLWRDCPRCFYLTMNGIWSRPRGIVGTLQNGMDGSIKGLMDEHRPSGTLPTCIHIEGELFRDEKLLDEWRNPFKGLRYRTPEGDLFFGAPDEIIVEDGKLVIVDFKTRGYGIRENTSGYYQHQLDSYAFLLEQNGYPVASHAYLIYWIPRQATSDALVQFQIQLDKVSVHPKRAERLFYQALACARGEEPTSCCEYCANVPRQEKFDRRLERLRDTFRKQEVIGTVVP